MESQHFGIQQHYVVSTQQKATKRLVHDAIKAKDSNLVFKLIKLFDVAPNEQLSAENFYWTCLHYACYYNASVILSYLLRLVYEHSKDDYSKIVNSKTKEGYNLLMIASMTGSDSCVSLLLNYGGIKLFERDNLGLKASDMAKKYGKAVTFGTLAEVEKLYTSMDPSSLVYLETPLKTELLDKAIKAQELSKPSQAIPDKAPPKKEDQDEYYNLLKYGFKLPCIVCFGDKGWLKYAACCGDPFHEGCVKGVGQCPSCSGKNMTLSDDVLIPERAYVIYD